MSDGFNLDDLKEQAETTVENTEAKSKNLVPWLEDPKECDHCGAYCDATVEHVDTPAYVGYTEVWKCPNCSTRYYRGRI